MQPVQTAPCPRCRRPIAFRTPQCPYCGNVFASLDPGHDAGTRMLLPVGRTALSIVAGYVGLVSIAIFPLAPVAIILGILAARDIKARPGTHGMGRAVFAIVIGALVSLAVAVILAT